MGIIDSMKGRLGFNDNDRNWDSYSQDDDRYDDPYPSQPTPRGTRRSVTDSSSRASSSRPAGRGDSSAQYNNDIIAQRYAEDSQASGTVRPRSSSTSSYGASSYGTGDNTPLLSYSDIASSRPGSSRPGADGGYGGTYSLRNARSEGSGGGMDFPSPSTSLHLDRDLRSSMASGSNNSLKELYAERTRIESPVQDRGYPNGNGSAFETGSSTSRNTSRAPRSIHVIAPQVYEDVKGIAKNSKDGNLVVIVLTSTPSDLGRRILDFSFGVASALGGSVERLADRVFLLQKGNPLSESEREQLRRQGII